MSSPLPPVPGETPEQRQARFAAAAAVQNRIDQQARDEEARRAAAMYAAMPQPVAMPLTLNNVPMRNVANPQSHISDFIATMNAPPAYDAAAAYRNNSQGLLDALNAGQITAERANQLKAPMFEATKLGNTAEGQAAMQAAMTQAQGGMPMAGYDPAAQYRGFGNDLMALINSGAITPQQANAIKAPVFEAVRLGNTNQGYNQMQAALDAARRNMSQYTAPVQPMPQPVQPVVPQPMPQPMSQPMPQGQPTPVQPTPVQGMYRGGFAVR